MIELTYGDYTIIKEKKYYTLVESFSPNGDSKIVKINIDGKTRLVDKRVRTDGYTERYAIKVLCTYDERAILRKMLFGLESAIICRPITLSIFNESSRVKIVSVVNSDEGSFYSEASIIEGLDVDVNPSDYGFSNENKILYEIDILLINISPN